MTVHFGAAQDAQVIRNQWYAARLLSIAVLLAVEPCSCCKTRPTVVRFASAMVFLDVDIGLRLGDAFDLVLAVAAILRRSCCS